MCSVLVRERPGGVGHCLATTRDENGCVRDCVSVWSKISKISNCLGIPTNTKRSNRIHLGGDFDSQHAILKKHTVCFEKNRPQVPQSPTAQVQSNASFSCPIAA